MDIISGLIRFIIRCILIILILLTALGYLLYRSYIEKASHSPEYYYREPIYIQNYPEPFPENPERVPIQLFPQQLFP